MNSGGKINLDVTQEVDWKQLLPALQGTSAAAIGEVMLDQITMAAMGPAEGLAENEILLLKQQMEALKGEVAKKDAEIRKKDEEIQKWKTKPSDLGQNRKELTVAVAMHDQTGHSSHVGSANKELYFERNGLRYLFEDVPGDGNCLFSALACIPDVPCNSSSEVRNAIVLYVLHGRTHNNAHSLQPAERETLQKATQKFYKKNVKDWAKQIQKDRIWGTVWEIAIIAIMCRIEIVILTHLPHGYHDCSMKQTVQFQKCEALLKSFPNMVSTYYLLHHKFLSPLEPGDPSTFNHFGYLREVTTIPPDAQMSLHFYGCQQSCPEENRSSTSC